jgi:hypothetical protein
MKELKPEGEGWVVVMERGAVMKAEEIRCLLEARGLRPVVLNAPRATAVGAIDAAAGARVIVPIEEVEEAGDLLRDAGLLEGELPVAGGEPR